MRADYVVPWRTDFHLLLSSQRGGVPLSRIAPVLAHRCDRDSELAFRCFGISQSRVPRFDRPHSFGERNIFAFACVREIKFVNDLTKRIRCTRVGVGRCAFGHGNGSDVCGLISTGAWNREIADAEGEMPRNGYSRLCVCTRVCARVHVRAPVHFVGW